MNFCTISDDKHFPLLLNLIGSVHKHNYNELNEIMVFNLGLREDHIQELNNIDKVKIYEIEKTNPDILKDIQTDKNRYVKGLFSWKPVIIKQALDIHNEILYLDAGTTLLKPINILFEHIKENGYLFFDCGHSIKWMTTNHVINKFELNKEENKWLLDDNVFGIDAGFQGISRKIYNDYVLPMYELSKDINNFVDNGTCPQGWGTGRHDQTLFSILARKLKYNILIHGKEISYLNINNKQIPFHLTHLPNELKSETHIFRSRWKITQESLNNSLFFIRPKQEKQIKSLNLEILKNDFEHYSKTWKNNNYINEKIYIDFENKVDEYPFLKNHCNIVSMFNLGYGEKAFRYLWLLLFTQAPEKIKFLEIGVFKGSILALSQMCAYYLNKDIETYGLTPLNSTGDKYSKYTEDNYFQSISFLYNKLNIKIDKTHIIHGLSTDEIIKENCINKGPYDIVYIDGGHDYDTVINDIELANKILKPQGFLIMDDASSYLNFNDNHKGFKGHSDVGIAIKDKLDLDNNYKHLFACGHNRVWQRMQPNKI